MSLIYEPTGKAREYSPLALNVYSGGCDHACRYCYCAQIQRGNWGNKPSPRNLRGLENEAKNARRQILLSFISDPYNGSEPGHRATRAALEVLKTNGCSVAILSKGGSRCLMDVDMFASWPGERIKVGATLTFMAPRKSLEEEPGAALPADRLKALQKLHDYGVKTWASIEPVIDPVESLEVIKASLPFVDAYKVGKLNHRSNTTDWKSFGIQSVNMIRDAGKKLYVKDDLRPYLPTGFLHPDECTPETVFLPDRPNLKLVQKEML